jgi:glucose/mannose-6-phosphate isomerase
MLDDLKLINERDPQDTLGIAERQPAQLREDLKPTPGFEAKNTIDKVVYSGMGGSALAALYISSWPRLKIPFEVVRNYDIPDYVDESTLFIAASYSGNTEETISAIDEAEQKNAQIVVISGGGKLADLAKEKNYPLVTIPKAEQPRYAVLYNLKGLINILEEAGLLESGKFSKELEDAANFLEESVKAWTATVPTANNQAKQIAQEMIGKSAVIYAGPKFAPAAYKWKISFNENAKHIAWTDQLSEFNHNEFIGWTKQPTEKPYAVIDLRSNLEHERIQKRFVVTEKLLSGMRPAPIVVQAEGNSLLEQLLWVTALGDFVTLYTAILSGINPAPVDLVEKFKLALND